jgi:Ca2+-binding RTX toxin-like protein
MIKSLRSCALAVGAVALFAVPFAATPAGAAGGPVLVQFNSSADLDVIDAPGNSVNLRVTGYDANFRVESSIAISAGRGCTKFQTGNKNRPFGANCNYRPAPGDNAQFTPWQAGVLGGDGNDVILYEVPRGGLVAGGAGNDRISVSGGITLNVYALGDMFGNNPGDGADTIESFRPAALLGGGGNDVLEGSGSADILVGDAGNDTLRAKGGADTINSADGQVDSIVNCGPSDGANDAVQFDSFDGMRDCSNNDLFA